MAYCTAQNGHQYQNALFRATETWFLDELCFFFFKRVQESMKKQRKNALLIYTKLNVLSQERAVQLAPNTY